MLTAWLYHGIIYITNQTKPKEEFKMRNYLTDMIVMNNLSNLKTKRDEWDEKTKEKKWVLYANESGEEFEYQTKVEAIKKMKDMQRFDKANGLEGKTYDIEKIQQ